ncbi:Asp23/Gls24 family envelope stress response protein [Bacillus taeanensis]|nr:Asp23/Gls24 family envelope stress response protein [Bacillus taeanensis]
MVVKHLLNDSIQITDYVIALIAAEVIKEIPAIQLASGNFREEIMNAVHKKYAAKGIYVSTASSYVDIKVRTAIQYGENIAEVSYALQKFIKKQVEKITGLQVKKIDIFVEKVFFE